MPIVKLEKAIPHRKDAKFAKKLEGYSLSYSHFLGVALSCLSYFFPSCSLHLCGSIAVFDTNIIRTIARYICTIIALLVVSGCAKGENPMNKQNAKIDLSEAAGRKFAR